MTYWHMQLHPKNKEWGRERKLLEKKALIGLGLTNENQVKQFKDDMHIDDIVLIKRGATPIALTQIKGEWQDSKKNNFNEIDWFQYRRKVEVLQFATDGMLSFPQPRKALQKSINKYTMTYKYIDNWYKDFLNPNQNDMGLKIKKVTIESYKILNDFSIDFLDNDNNPLSLVVIAGKNGTGKTTLFEYITHLDIDRQHKIKYQLDGKSFDDLQNHQLIGTTQIEDNVSRFSEHIIYLPASTINDNEIEKLILDYIDYFIYDKSENAAVGTENLQDDIDEIFDGFNLSFQFKKIDYKTKKPLFENHDSVRDDIEFKLKDLSTGEKTLLSKVLYLYLKDPKDKVILIDEPETSLHPSWQNRVLNFYENFAKINNNQIIIATHSPHIIGSAKNEYIRVLRAIDSKIEADKFSQGNGLKFSEILTDVMDVKHLRSIEVDEKLINVKAQIVKNDFKSEEFTKEWGELEKLLGKKNLELKLLKLEIKSREKNVSDL